MSFLPLLSAREVIKALERVGYVRKRQTGSHVHLKHPDKVWIVTVPWHDEFCAGTLHGILKQSHMTKEEFIEL